MCFGNWPICLLMTSLLSNCTSWWNMCRSNGLFWEMMVPLILFFFLFKIKTLEKVALKFFFLVWIYFDPNFSVSD